ncbi:outer membrane protein assembly factor BamD [Lebetimonas natsushimae]|uniref:Outer membrane protein assembly factor BamD n=1 Tax=Lebetimonas natsushimae TaxID=1936991 RepID=A0A292YH04_9BACT|nr:outer membrane protein assembly factor BamD [Lebetimonas natsushimae]GAX88110.1 outer membrane protein assembly factor BamD [Lebetimonas natsushimae]
MLKKTLLLLPFLFLACSNKNVVHYENLTALKWHNRIAKDVKSNNLDQADDDFLSLEAEHPASPYIKTDLIILALAHANIGEFKVAKFYLNQYEKRFASSKEIPWLEYEKIKFDFIKYNNPYTNQKDLLDLIDNCKKYLKYYPNSQFKYEVNTILAKAELTKKYLNDKIYKLYKKLDKPKAAKEFKTDIPKNSEPPYVPWYKKIFYW